MYFVARNCLSMSAEKTPKPKMGRPVTVGEDVVVRNVRLARAHDEAMSKAARKANKSKSEWMRSILVGAVEQAA
jgi:hypothetical protein